MKKIFNNYIIYLAGCFLFLASATAGLAADDGFSQAKKLEGEYFIIYYMPGTDIAGLVQKLNIGPAQRIFAGQSAKKEATYEEDLIDVMDALFLYISDILDMHIYSFQGTLKICKDKAQLNSVYRTLFGKELKSSSLYVSGISTIYISPESFTKEVLGHEIAHFIISRYFVVQPPERAAEILAGYVEYQLRKK